MNELTRLLSAIWFPIPSVNPMGRSLSGPELFRDPADRFPGSLVSGTGGSLPAPCRGAGPRQSAGLVRCPGRGPAHSVRRASGYRADRWDDDSALCPRDRWRPPLWSGIVRRQGLDGGDAVRLRPARPRAPAGSASVLLACTVDEEFTHIGSSRLAEINHGAELAIVAEPTLLNLVHCHKGVLRCKIRTRGVACHSSTPASGQERHLPDGHGS